MESRLRLPQEKIDHARALAARIVAPVQEFIDAYRNAWNGEEPSSQSALGHDAALLIPSDQ